MHNMTLGSPLPTCNPNFLSTKSAVFQQERISAVTVGVSQHLAPCVNREGRKWDGVKTKCENSLDGDCRLASHHGFTLDTGQWTGSHLSELVCHRPVAVVVLMFLAGTCVTTLPPRFSPLCLSPTVTSFLSISCHSQQHGAALRSSHSSKDITSPSLGSSWASDTSAEQGSRSGSTFIHTSLQQCLSHHQQHLHHPPPSTNASHAYCLTDTAVSTELIIFIFQ